MIVIQYRVYRNKLTHIKEHAKRLYIKNLENDKKRDISSLWKIINKIIHLKNVKKNNIPIKIRGGVEDTRLKAKDTKKFRGQGQPFRGQTLSRPRTGMLEAKAMDQGHRRKRSKKKKVFKIFFQAISNSLAYPEF